MKITYKIILFFFLLFTVRFVVAQQSHIDSLHHEIAAAQNDTNRLILFGRVIRAYSELIPDSAYYYAEKMLSIARKLNLRLEEVRALAEIAYAQINVGNYPRSLQTLLSAFAIAENPNSEQKVLPAKYPASDEFTDRSASPHLQRLHGLSRIHQHAGILYSNSNNYEKALSHFFESRRLAEQSGNRRMLIIIDLAMGRTYLSLKKTDSALISEQNAYKEAIRIGYKKYLGSILLNMARVFLAQANKQLAAEYFRKAITASMEQNYLRGVVAGNLALADISRQSGNRDSILPFIKEALPIARYLNAPDLLLRSYTALADYYKTVPNNDSAVKYQSLIIKINDSLFSTKQVQQFQNIDFDEQQKQQQIETAQAAYRSKIRIYILIAGLAIFLFIAIILWRNNKHRQKAYSLLIKQKQETDFQKSKVEQTLAELKSMQAQLIQSEKMASLGELTAGIAHEIQNPLNFVNNFSEVNNELLEEMKQEIEKGNFNEAKTIAQNIIENEQKILYHGKRADGIVKGMLQHSRISTGQKEPTDINVLVDECVRLSYHGMKAKDKSFSTEIKTDFDGALEKIDIVPQDIGRVLLNLLNNAFYATNEKKKQQPENYQPTVSVSTKFLSFPTAGGDGGKIEIKVTDNGNGIPQNIVDKIFQPFYTTKPTGQGTGLGLSLSYDIVKAHDGEIKVESKEGEGTEFKIKLMLSKT